MQPFNIVSGRVAVFDRADVDTDQIIPARHLKSTARHGFGRHAFAALQGKPGFFLADPPKSEFTFLVTGPNFGCGSSREHAPWALADLGLRALISPSFADIFRTNCERIGLLPIELDAASWRVLVETIEAAPRDITLTVDLARAEITCPAVIDARWTFDIAPHVQRAFMRGQDFVEAGLAHEAAIDVYERHRPSFRARLR